MVGDGGGVKDLISWALKEKDVMGDTSNDHKSLVAFVPFLLESILWARGGVQWSRDTKFDVLGASRGG